MRGGVSGGIAFGDLCSGSRGWSETNKQLRCYGGEAAARPQGGLSSFSTPSPGMLARPAASRGSRTSRPAVPVPALRVHGGWVWPPPAAEPRPLVPIPWPQALFSVRCAALAMLCFQKLLISVSQAIPCTPPEDGAGCVAGVPGTGSVPLHPLLSSLHLSIFFHFLFFFPKNFTALIPGTTVEILHKDSKNIIELIVKAYNVSAF